jgi:aromatic ring-opening dioxygenase LigB subunit
VYACLLQVDKLVESEEARLEEKKEAEYKPVVMGEVFFTSLVFTWGKIVPVFFLNRRKYFLIIANYLTNCCD